MAFQIIRNDITRVRADAIVNTANPMPVCGGGTDHAIYMAAGMEDLLKARRAIGEIARGQAVETPAFRLKARYIIHTVGPVWAGGESGEYEILRACYENSLKLALQLQCRSIAFPLIATGVYGFPKDRALQIAMSVIQSFLMAYPEMKVILVVFDKAAFTLSGSIVEHVREYVDANYVEAVNRREYAFDRFLSRRRQERPGMTQAQELDFSRCDQTDYAAARECRRKPIWEPENGAGASDEEAREKTAREETDFFASAFRSEAVMDDTCCPADSEAEATEDASRSFTGGVPEAAEVSRSLTSLAGSAAADVPDFPPVQACASVPDRMSEGSGVSCKQSASAPVCAPTAPSCSIQPAARRVDIGALIAASEKTFQEKLFEIIDARGLTGPQVYKNYISKQVYSKIQADRNYHPNKFTAIALCLSLHLGIEETQDLIGRAGWRLSPSNKTDLVVKGCIINGVYNLVQINIILFDFDCPELEKIK